MILKMFISFGHTHEIGAPRSETLGKEPISIRPHYEKPGELSSRAVLSTEHMLTVGALSPLTK